MIMLGWIRLHPSTAKRLCPNIEAVQKFDEVSRKFSAYSSLSTPSSTILEIFWRVASCIWPTAVTSKASSAELNCFKSILENIWKCCGNCSLPEICRFTEQSKGNCRMKMASSSNSKDPDPCAICLEPVKQEAYLDCCFHTFCYPCIVYWSNILRKKTEALSSIKCPLCKMENFSIIHSFDGEYFQQHYISQVHTQNFLSSAHNFRLQWYKTDVRDSINASNVKLYWKHHKYLRGNAWLESWLRREIQALTLEEDVDIIVHHILGVIESFVKREQGENMKNVLPLEKRREFKGLVSDAARPFLSGRTERFVDEMEWFLMLGLNITAYDEICMQSFASRSACGE